MYKVRSLLTYHTTNFFTHFKGNTSSLTLSSRTNVCGYRGLTENNPSLLHHFLSLNQILLLPGHGWVALVAAIVLFQTKPEKVSAGQAGVQTSSKVPQPPLLSPLPLIPWQYLLATPMNKKILISSNIIIVLNVPMEISSGWHGCDCNFPGISSFQKYCWLRLSVCAVQFDTFSWPITFYTK